MQFECLFPLLLCFGLTALLTAEAGPRCAADLLLPSLLLVATLFCALCVSPWTRGTHADPCLRAGTLQATSQPRVPSEGPPVPRIPPKTEGSGSGSESGLDLSDEVGAVPSSGHQKRKSFDVLTTCSCFQSSLPRVTFRTSRKGDASWTSW